MRIFDLTCDQCGAAYDVAESMTLEGDASEFRCAICGNTLLRLDDRRHRVCRMEMFADHPCFHGPQDAPAPISRHRTAHCDSVFN
jgi:hypothetical protein